MTKTLPPELLSMVFEHLPQKALYNCTIVNKYFKIASTPILWRVPSFHAELSLKLFAKSLSTTRISRGNLVRKFLLTYNDHTTLDDDLLPQILDDDLLLQIIYHTPLLEVINVANCRQLSDRSLKELGARCPMLETVILENVPITFRTVYALGQSCPHLKTLDLRGCGDLTMFGLLPFTKSCSLVTLNVSGCHWLNDVETAQDIRQFTRLQTLELVNCRVITDRFLLNLITADFDELTSIFLSGNFALTDASLVPFLQNHSQIQQLTLARCAITDVTLYSISRYLTDITFLDVSFCGNITGRAARHVIASCHSLVIFGLKNCENVKVQDFPELTLEVIDTLFYNEIDTVRTAEEDAVSSSNSN